MKITPTNLINHELIGLAAHVVASSDPGLVCRAGTIVDETKEMIRLNTTGRIISLPKSVCVIDLGLPDGTTVRVDGEHLRGRPEERLKKRLRRRW